MKEIGNALKIKDRASNLMSEVLQRNPIIEDRNSNPGSEVKSKYK